MPEIKINDVIKILNKFQRSAKFEAEIIDGKFSFLPKKADRLKINGKVILDTISLQTMAIVLTELLQEAQQADPNAFTKRISDTITKIVEFCGENY
jgi:hypothetical protein